MASLAERLARVARRHTLLLTHHGRRSGKPYDVTIWFVVEGEIVWLASADLRRQWTRNVRVRPDVSVAIAGERFTGTVEPVTDAASLAHVVDLLGEKYWFAKPVIWFDQWLGRAGLGPYGGAFRLLLR